MITLNKTASSYKSDILDYLTNYYSDLDTTESSFINRLVSALASGNEVLCTTIDDLIKENSFDLNTNTNLDIFFGYFDINRLTNVDGSCVIDLIYSGNSTFIIPAGTLFLYGTDYYFSKYKTTISNAYTFEHFSIECIPTSENNVLISDFVEIGTLKIKVDDLNYTNSKLDLISDLVANLKVSNFKINSTSVESDTSFLYRAKNVFQFLAADTLTKIERSLTELSDVAYVASESLDLTTNITVFPTDINKLDSLIETTQEIVNYYKVHKVIIKKPTLVSFEVHNVLSQLDSKYQADVKSFISVYLKNIYNDSNTFKFEDFIFKLIEYIRSIHDTPSTLIFDKSLVDVFYNIYANCDFDLNISSGKIYPNTNKSFVKSVFSLYSIN